MVIENQNFYNFNRSIIRDDDMGIVNAYILQYQNEPDSTSLSTPICSDLYHLNSTKFRVLENQIAHPIRSDLFEQSILSGEYTNAT